METWVTLLGIGFGMIVWHVVSDWWHGWGKPALTESPKQVASRWTPTVLAVVWLVGIIGFFIVLMWLTSSSGCTGWEARAMTC